MTEPIDEWLIRNRKRAGLSQKGLADLVGVSQQTIGKLENGKSLSTRHLYRIAQALKVSQDEIDKLPIDDDWRLQLSSHFYREVYLSTPERRKKRLEDSAFNHRDDRTPLYRMANLIGKKVIMDTHISESISKPEVLNQKVDGYAVRSIFFEMQPVYDPGDIIIADPEIVAAIGDDCIFRQKSSMELIPESLIGRVVSANAEGWTVMQHTPSVTFDLSAGSYDAHPIVGRYITRPEV